MVEALILLIIGIVLGTAVFLVEECWLSYIFSKEKKKEKREEEQIEEEDIVRRSKLDSSINSLVNQILDMDDCTEHTVYMAIKLVVQRDNKDTKDMLEKLTNKLIDIRLRKIVGEKENPAKFVKTNPLPTKTENGIL